MLKTSIAQLLEKEMDRTDFLKHVGIGLVALTGATALVKTLSAHPTAANKFLTSSSNQSQGYGSTSYGGGKVSS